MEEDPDRKPDLFSSFIEYLLLSLFNITRLLSHAVPPSLLNAVFNATAETVPGTSKPS